MPGRLLVILGLLVLGGCVYPVRQQADHLVCDLAARPLDLQTSAAMGSSVPTTSAEEPAAPSGGGKGGAEAGTADAEVRPAGAQEPAAGENPLPQPRPLPRPRVSMTERMRIPAGLPGSGAPSIPVFPRFDPKDPGARERAINGFFTALPPLGPEPRPASGPDGRPLTLADLERLAMANSPVLRQVASDVEAAKGAAIQAGAYPNPNFGYQADTTGTGGTAGYQGIFIEQVIKTGGKLKLAQAAATMDLLNAQLALRRAQSDLMAQVRAGYFAVLVAQENIRVSRAFAELADSAYGIQLDLLKGGELAAYEPMQLRVLSMTARGALVQARNRYVAAWKQLAATLGLPGMPLTQLAGRVDRPIPMFGFDTLLAAVLNRHTDVLAAQNTVQRNRYNLRLAQMAPVPDVSLHWYMQKDYTVPPFTVVNGLQMGVPLPVWDQNKGNIIQAQANLLRAVEEAHRVRSDLSGRLADAFQRYEDNRRLVEYYRDWILPDQIRAYRAIYQRYQGAGDIVGFVEVITAQQTLAGAITTYVTTLGAQWTAVVDLAALLQSEDLFAGVGASDAECVTPVPDLRELAPLPCCHPCTPLHDPALKGADPVWHAAMPPSGPGPAPTGQDDRETTRTPTEPTADEARSVRPAVRFAEAEDDPEVRPAATVPDLPALPLPKPKAR